MTTFVLVHGAWHGGWCWERLVPALATAGHRAITMDLPVSDGTATLADYAATVGRVVPDEPCVLVGHSLGSVVGPLVAAEHAQVQHVVFLCGVVPKLDARPWDGTPRMEAPGAFDGLIEHPDGSTTWADAEAARRAFYGHCAASDATWAFKNLRAQNNTSLWKTPYPLTTWPDARYSAISCTDDAAVTLAFSRHVCRERLDIEPIEIPGDHSPFLADPVLLADVLGALVR